MTVLGAIAGILVVLGLWFWWAYNRGIALRNYKEEAFSTMDVYMKKRWDLIPNLLETTKGYAQHEKGVLEDVTKLRNLNYGNMSDNEKVEVNSKLSMGLSKLLAVAENYPDLKASDNFQQLSKELASIEGEIATSRKYYNGTIRELNMYIESFPTNIVASVFKFEKGVFFEIEEAQRENIQIKF